MAGWLPSRQCRRRSVRDVVDLVGWMISSTDSVSAMTETDMHCPFHQDPAQRSKSGGDGGRSAVARCFLLAALTLLCCDQQRENCVPFLTPRAAGCTAGSAPLLRCFSWL